MVFTPLLTTLIGIFKHSALKSFGLAIFTLVKRIPVLAITALLTYLIAFAFIYRDFVFAPNAYLHSNWGDGIKNYYTYANFIENEQSWTEEENINYPYGESVFYLDANPALAAIVRSLTTVFPGLGDYKIGIFNLLMLLSIPLGAWFIFLTFRVLDVESSISFLAGLGMVALNPQILRMLGHFSLSYSFFIPILIYLLLKFNGRTQCLKCLYLSILLLFFFFTHAYLGMIGTAFVFLFLSMKEILEPTDDRKFLNSTFFTKLAFSILPLIFFFVLTKLSDHHLNRTDNPYGFLDYNSHVRDLLIPAFGYMRDFYGQFTRVSDVNWEGTNYVGIVVLIGNILIWSVGKWRTLILGNKSLLNLNISALFLYLFSTGFPFTIGLEEFANDIPYIKQFRSLGRFSWPFYYSLSFNLFYVIGKSQWKYALPLSILSSALLIFESIPYHEHIQKEFLKSANPFTKENSFNYRVDNSESALILPIPFYHMGSENFDKSGNNDIYRASMLLSYHNNIPMVSHHAARVSISESREMMGVLGDFYLREENGSILDKEKVVLVYNDENLSALERIFLSDLGLIPEREPSFTILNTSDLFTRTGPNLDAGSSLLLYYLTGENTSMDSVGFCDRIYGPTVISPSVLDTIFTEKISCSTELSFGFWMLNDPGNKSGQDYLVGNQIYMHIFQGSELVNQEMIRPNRSQMIYGDSSFIFQSGIMVDSNQRFVLTISTKDKIPSGQLHLSPIQVYKKQSCE